MRIDLKIKEKKVTGSVAHNDEHSIPLKGSKEKELVKKLAAFSKHNIGLLPPAVRWISRDKSIVVFERPPMRQLIEFLPYERQVIKDDYDYRAGGDYCSYELNIPWTVYVCTFDATYLPVTVKVFVRNSPITSMDDLLGLLPMLNFYSNSKLCNPATKIFEGMPESLGEGINMAYNLVWNSGWNFDLHDAINLSLRHAMPFHQNEYAKGKIIYTNAESKALKYAGNAASVIGLYRYWATKSMDEILNRQWATPASAVKGKPSAKGLSLYNAISNARSELAGDEQTQSRTFLVNIASSLM